MNAPYVATVMVFLACLENIMSAVLVQESNVGISKPNSNVARARDLNPILD
jgi:hypothetical protein